MAAIENGLDMEDSGKSVFNTCFHCPLMNNDLLDTTHFQSNFSFPYDLASIYEPFIYCPESSFWTKLLFSVLFMILTFQACMC